MVTNKHHIKRPVILRFGDLIGVQNKPHQRADQPKQTQSTDTAPKSLPKLHLAMHIHSNRESPVPINKNRRLSLVRAR